MKAVIKGQSKIDSVVGKAGFTAFSKVSSLTFFETPEAPRTTYSLLIVLESDWPRGNIRLRIAFTGVKNLVLRDFGAWPTQVTGFDIVDVTGRQLEGMNFEIRDYEHDMIRFFCGAVEVLDVERTGPSDD